MPTPVIAYTMGDPGGIGPEILVRALRDQSARAAGEPLIVGDRAVMKRHGWRPRLSPLLDVGIPCDGRARRPTREGGRASFEAVRLALALHSKGIVDAIVTAPVAKEAWALAGVGFLDHTSFFEESVGRKGSMMLMAGSLRAVLATRHLPLREVSRRLTTASAVEAAHHAWEGLRRLGVRRPRLAFCGLNPHAGEGGHLGDEERRVIAPAIRRLGRSGISVLGPIAADAAWAEHAAGGLDGLIALYHDQALIPLKVARRYGVVNWTLGLPILRTSPGHGTAFDIAGKGKARPDAMIAAARLAGRLAAKSSRYRDN